MIHGIGKELLICQINDELNADKVPEQLRLSSALWVRQAVAELTAGMPGFIVGPKRFGRFRGVLAPGVNISTCD